MGEVSRVDKNGSLLNLFTQVELLSHVRLFATPWTVAHQAPPSMEFTRQEYWSGLPFPSPGDLPDPGIKPPLLSSTRVLYHWAARAACESAMCTYTPSLWGLPVTPLHTTLNKYSYPYSVSSSGVGSEDIAVNEQAWTLSLGGSQVSREARPTGKENTAGEVQL